MSFRRNLIIGLLEYLMIFLIPGFVSGVVLGIFIGFCIPMSENELSKDAYFSAYNLGYKSEGLLPSGEVIIVKQSSSGKDSTYTDATLLHLCRYTTDSVKVGKSFHCFSSEEEIIIKYMGWNPDYILEVQE